MRAIVMSLLMLCVSSAALYADETQVSAAISADSVSVQPKRGLIKRIIDYFDDTNKPKVNKPFDISFIGGPHYSSDTKFGIGLVAAGVYRTDMTDTVTQPSTVSVYFDATTSAFFKLGVCGNHIFRNDKRRIDYDINFSSVSTKFWGIGYDECSDDNNESKYKYLNSQARASFLYRIMPDFFIGPSGSFDYINGRHFAKPELWHGESDRTFNMGIGFTIQYDTRDVITNAYKGVHFRIDQRFYPRFLANKYAFSMTELTAAYYRPLWRDVILATCINGRLTYGNTPWGLLSTLGGDNMRGYFEGRYRDKCQMNVCVELRQHVWRRNGVVLWGGAGTIFPKFSAIKGRTILPNYGVGYRWEFKRRMNIRLDLGFGRHQTGFIFSMNEAF